MVKYSYSPQKKEGFLYGFTTAYRAPARFFEPIPFCEDKTALLALGRGHHKMTISPADTLLDMFQMIKHFPYRDTDFGGYVSGREGVPLKEIHYFLADGLVPFLGNE